jgi:hypothetical protein
MGGGRRMAAAALALVAAPAAVLGGNIIKPDTSYRDLLLDNDTAGMFLFSLINLDKAALIKEWDFEEGKPRRTSASSGNFQPLTLEAASAPALSFLRDGGTTGNMVLGFPFDLHPPFRWEVRAGRIRPDSAGAMTCFFCTELDVRGSSPLEFYALCAQPSGDGYQVWVARAGENLLGLTTIAGTAALDFAVSHDGETMTFEARPAGEGEYQEIHSLAHAATAALNPAIGGALLPNGARVDFAAFRVASNGPLPGGASPEETHARALLDAGVPLADGFHAVDSFPVDPDAGESFAAAAEALAEASDALKADAAGLADPKAARRAAKAARGAAAAARKAASLVAKGKSDHSVAKAGLKGLILHWMAVQGTDPHALPGKL